MEAAVLVTKLFIPRTRPNSVARPGLIERLNRGLHGSLSLIAAPAGFGKTTLVSEWIAGCAQPVAWLSLDEGDNDPTRFLVHLIAAVQRFGVERGDEVLGALQSAQPPPAEIVLTAILNDIAALPERCILVIDDYHVIEAESVASALAFLLEHLPPQLHLVIVTREDPVLPLARFRARGQLTELRAAELRFAPAEAAAFLNSVMELDLSSEEVAALEDRTEGWIAGLQLAALSMRGRSDVAEFIHAFEGSHRYIMDYLVDEVLQRQPDDVRNFLLQTSILERLSGPLCDAVTGQERSAARLDSLERGNFFVIPLDDRRQWYRYHHLFAEMLQAHLRAEQPDRAASLHQRASVWFEQCGSVADAIHHAIAAGDVERAADLIERAMPSLRRSRQEATLLGWLEALPDHVFCRRPVLSTLHAGVRLMTGRFEGVEARLQLTERWLSAAIDRSAMVFMDEAEWRRLPGTIAVYRAAIAQASGQVAEAIQCALQALDVAPRDDDLVRGSAAGFLGLAAWTSGELETGHRMYAECMASLRRIGFRSDMLGCALALADIRMAQGRRREAMRTYDDALRLVADAGRPALRGTADMYVGLSELHREGNDLEKAAQLLGQCRELGEFSGLPQNPYRWCVAMAQVREAHSDLPGALDLLEEAERRYNGDFFPNVRPVAAMKARVWLRQGRVGEALKWTLERGLSPADRLSYLREFEHITLARTLLGGSVAHQPDLSVEQTIDFLNRLLVSAEEGERMRSVIEILILLALAHQAVGDLPTAVVRLRRALMLAEPEGYIRLFVDEGPPMEYLLRVAAARGVMPDYAGELLAAFQSPGSELTASAHIAPPKQQSLSEPLSRRELDVLRLLNSELSGPDIARELVVALSTIRSHTKSIYGKLGVTTRHAAIKRAGELGLI